MYLEQALSDGYAQIIGEGKQAKITYLAVNITEKYNDPEEKVRAEFWAELIYRYGYSPQRIGVEVVVPDRVPNDRADLIIFRDDERKRPYAVIECKREGITDAEFEQAVQQAFGNGNAHKFRAEYVMVIAGNTRRAFDFSDKYGVLEREQNIIADLPVQYGKPQAYKYHYKAELDIKPVSRQELISAIKKSHQSLWAGGKLSPHVAFSELSKIIFVKISDELKPRRKNEPYEFQIKTHENSHQLGKRIRALYEEQRKRDPDVFSDTIRVDDGVLSTVVSHLESINLSKTDLDTKGIAFEQFMDGFFKGDYGQFFTPRTVIEFAVKMMEIQNHEWVLDPACGSGGFLLYALDNIRNQAETFYPDPEEAAEHYRYWHDFAQNRLFGIEISDEIARVAKMNMILHDDGHTNVIGEDALKPIIELAKLNQHFKEKAFDVVLSNPPFGSTIAKTERPYLETYDFGKQEQKNGKYKIRNNQKSEILFIERIWQFLKPSTGRAAIILPDGILTNSSLQYVRDWLLQHFQLNAVVSLPQTAFAHYGAGVKSSLIFVRRRGDNERPSDDEAIFMAAPELIGYDATGRETANQLHEVYEQYQAFRRDPHPFFV